MRESGSAFNNMLSGWVSYVSLGYAFGASLEGKSPQGSSNLA